MENEDINREPGDIQEPEGFGDPADYQEPESYEEPEVAEEEPAAPPFFSRVLGVFFSPGELFQKLRVNPVWFWTLLLAGVLIMVSTLFVPAEAWDQMLREQSAQSGAEVPEQMGQIIRITGTIFAVLGVFVWAFIQSGLLMLLFTFFMGGDGTYKQYLSLTSHTMLISALGALVTTPLKVAKLDPQLTLNLGTFLPFLEEGFALRFLTMMDLFALWGFAVLALGITKIDPRRTWGGTAAVIFGIWIVIAVAIAFFTG